MARTAPVPHFQFPAGSPTLRRASRVSPLGALFHGLALIGDPALRVVVPVLKRLYAGFIDAQQGRADRRVRAIANGSPRLRAELAAFRERTATRQ